MKSVAIFRAQGPEAETLREGKLTLQNANLLLADLATGLDRTAVQARALLRRYMNKAFGVPFLYPGMRRAMHQPGQWSVAAESWVRAYPVPTNSQLRIECTLPSSAEHGRLLLTDAQGRTLREWSVQAGMQLVEADVRDLPVGIYHLRSMAESFTAQVNVAIAR